MSGGAWGGVSSGVGVGGGGTGPVSLADIMSEELAASLEAKEARAERSGGGGVEMGVEFVEEEAVAASPECSDDFLLAQMLQMELDREYDSELRRVEEAVNGKDKVRVSFSHYRQTHPYQAEDDDDEEDDEDLRELRQAQIYAATKPKFPPSGFKKRPDGSIVTKHDKTINGRSNAGRVMGFAPEMNTGDALGSDILLPNHVFNALKRHSNAESHRRMKLHEKKDASTADLAVDARTRLILFKMLDSEMLSSLSGAISTGKEALVLHAFGGPWPNGSKPVPPELALKVYKTTLQEFKNRVEYVKDDYRFRNPRKILKIWAEKEVMNLLRMSRAGMRCPRVFKLKGHVLLMSFIGSDGAGAPQLREAQLGEEELSRAFEEVKEGLHCLYHRCQLVHADLSEFNLLWFEGHVHFIDVSQAVDLSHPKALLFLARDCDRILCFFRKAGLEELPSPMELFQEITKISLPPSKEDFFVQVQDYILDASALERRRDKANPNDAAIRKAQEDEAEVEDLREQSFWSVLDRDSEEEEDEDEENKPTSSAKH